MGADETPVPPRGLWSQLVSEQRERRLSIRDLPRHARIITQLGLAFAAVLSLWIVLLGLGLPFGGTSQVIPGFNPIGDASHLVVVLWLTGLAFGAALLAGVVGETRIPTRLTLILIALIGAAVGGALVRVDDSLGYAVMGAEIPGWIAFISALAIAVVPLRLVRRARWLAPVLAATPFLVALIGYVLAGGETFRVANSFIAAHGTSWPNTVTARGVAGHELIRGSLGTLFLVFALLLWQVVEVTRGWNDFAGGAARLARGLPLALIALVTAKLVWMSIGYADALPKAMSGGGIWSESRDDGVLAWLLGAVLVSAGSVALIRTRFDERRVEEMRIAAWLIGGALVAGPFLAGLYVTVEASVGVVSSRAEDWLQQGDFYVLAAERWARIVAPYIAVVFGGLLVVKRRTWLAGTAVLLFGLWGLPRAVTLTVDLVRHPELRFPIGEISDFVEGDEQFRGWVNMATVDALLTLAIALLALLWLLGIERRLGPAALIYLLVFSTVVAHGEHLLSTEVEAIYFLLLVFPIAYAFLLDSEHLNAPSPDRTARVLAAVAAALLVLAVASFQVGNGFLFPGQPDYGDLGVVLAQLPLAMVFAAAVGLVGRSSRTSEP